MGPETRSDGVRKLHQISDTLRMVYYTTRGEKGAIRIIIPVQQCVDDAFDDAIQDIYGINPHHSIFDQPHIGDPPIINIQYSSPTANPQWLFETSNTTSKTQLTLSTPPMATWLSKVSVWTGPSRRRTKPDESLLKNSQFQRRNIICVLDTNRSFPQ